MSAELAEVVATLNRAYLFRHNSLAAYILKAEPFIAAGQEPLLVQIQEAARVDELVGANLAAAIEALGAAPHLAPPEPVFGEFNYLSIKYLSAILHERLGKEAEALRADLPRVHSCPSAWIAIQDALKATEEQLGRL